MSNEYKITYQGKEFLGNSVEEVVALVKKYAEEGIAPQTTKDATDKNEDKRIHQTMSIIRRQALEIRYHLELKWQQEILNQENPPYSCVCEKCGNPFVLSPSKLKHTPLLCSSCLKSLDDDFIRNEIGLKKSSFYHSPYNQKPVGVDEYSDRRFSIWYSKHYRSSNQFNSELVSQYKNSSFSRTAEEQWIKAKIMPVIHQYQEGIEHASGNELKALYIELAKCYCIIEQNAEAAKCVQKWLNLD